ncbi:MAG: hypothetical protein JNK72_27140 [Myxococcales bacterium]|nr:hypothetical protein [Myxococcales bacterium]
MDVKKALLEQAMKLAQNPKVMEVAMNPKVMEVAMKAMSLRAQVSSAASGAQSAVARSLNLATRDEVKELRRTIRKLEEQLAESEANKSQGTGDDF